MKKIPDTNYAKYYLYFDNNLSFITVKDIVVVVIQR